MIRRSELTLALELAVAELKRIDALASVFEPEYRRAVAIRLRTGKHLDELAARLTPLLEHLQKPNPYGNNRETFPLMNETLDVFNG